MLQQYVCICMYNAIRMYTTMNVHIAYIYEICIYFKLYKIIYKISYLYRTMCISHRTSKRIGKYILVSGALIMFVG